jgi:hypothetical protein
MSDPFDWDKEHDESIGLIVVDSEGNTTEFEARTVEQPEEAPVTAFDAPQEAPVAEKPVFSHGEHTLLGSDIGRPRVVNQGPEVAYINAKFGIEGDQYTQDTAAAVSEYFRAQGLRPETRLTRAQYESL